MTDELLQRSYDIRRGEKVGAAEGFKIAKSLADSQRFDPAWRLARHLIDTDNVEPEDAVTIRQKLALWISKNPDAPDDFKHDDALDVLDRIGRTEGGGHLTETDDPETLGIAGGICKRKWQVTGRQEDLERSLDYYERGAEQGVERDNGYTAINAAFIHDLLDEKEKARTLRESVRDGLLAIEGEPAWEGGPLRKDIRWFNETVAEAFFGLGDYENATIFLQRAYTGEKPAPWELETTARQFAWLARLLDPEATTPEDFERSEAWGVLRKVYGANAAAAAPSLFAGKLGLALSGGGFRASLFHIGVLAALAERDMLRHVDVLSCVSGGSILGAHYYLEVRQLLQTRGDGDITRDDYVEIVERLSQRFLGGVQQNLRTRIGSSPLASLRMAFQPGYSTSKRLGELYETYLYDRVDDDKKRRLRELLIRPKDDEDCNPKYDNWKRRNKAPILILNATTLNTGHNWQFTASWMGEPPAFIDSEIDGNYRLRRMYLEDEAPEPHRDIRIGDAVAASSCVPGLFDPLELRDLYEDGVTVRLVDGGVHDNQGVFGLLDQNCSVMIVSDASGQMAAIDQPADDPVGVLLRATSMLQARVRAAEYREIEARRRSGLLKGLLFLHLKKDLEVEDRNWVNCRNPKQLLVGDLHKQRSDLTSYGIFKPFQRLIAGIRTDLDSFNETEACALMASGYKMADTHIAGSIQGFPIDDRRHGWSFQSLAPALRDPSANELERLLGVAGTAMLKIWALSKPLRTFKAALTLAIAAVLLFAAWAWGDQPLFSFQGMAAAIGLFALIVAFTKLGLGPFLRLLGFRKTAHQLLLGFALGTVGWLGSWLHLAIFDPLYLAKGKLRKPPN